MTNKGHMDGEDESKPIQAITKADTTEHIHTRQDLRKMSKCNPNLCLILYKMWEGDMR